MTLRIRPVDVTFFDLFTEAAQHLVTGAGLLAEMLSETSEKSEVAARMHAAEHDADETAHAIVRRVAGTFVTPFDREDIYRLAGGLDDVMDEMDRTVDMILTYRVKVLPPELSEQVEVLRQCADLTATSMPDLRSLGSLEEYWIEVNRLQNAGDRTHRRLMAQLFSGEFKALEVLKLKEIGGSLQAAVDAFETVAGIVEQIAVKES